MSSDTHGRKATKGRNEAVPHGTADLATARPRSADGVLTVDVADELLLYAAHQQTATSLNRSARAIWELCDGKRTVLDIAEEIGRQLDCDNRHAFEQLAADIHATVQELERTGLLTLGE